MSKLDELINKLCPDGVEYKKIKDCYSRLRGTPITAEKMKEIESPTGDVRIFAGGKTVINAKENDIPNANITRVPAVLVQSRGVIDAIYYEKPFTFKNEMWAYTTNEKVSVKYLYYILKNNVHIFREAASGMGSLPQISLKVTEEFEIPVPPLEIQNEIVRILDNFTELEEELEEELEARRKQYEYYRDSLLSFDDSVEWKTLGDISTVNRGIRVTRDMLSTEGSIPVYQNALAPLGYFEKSNRKKDTTFVISAGAAGQIGYSGIDFWAADDCFTFDDTNNVLSKYIFYFLQTKQTYIDSRVRRGSIPRISRDVFEKMKIPLPKIEVQKRIVDILDRFESLTTDIKAGLPAEIEARHKQYEYYRDKLLTFKRKSA